MKKRFKYLLLFLILCCTITMLISCSNKAVGKYSLLWIDTKYGTMYDTPDLCIELMKDKTFTYGESEGTWRLKKGEIKLTYSTGETATLSRDGDYLKQNFYSSSLGNYEYTFGKDG